MSVDGHPPECACGHRRYVSGVDILPDSLYNDAVDDSFMDDDFSDSLAAGPTPYQSGAAAPLPSPYGRPRRQVPAILDDDEEEEDDMDTFLDSDEAQANNLTEQQIQNLIKSQVRTPTDTDTLMARWPVTRSHADVRSLCCRFYVRLPV